MRFFGRRQPMHRAYVGNCAPRDQLAEMKPHRFRITILAGDPIKPAEGR
jgi:hypothetical protein